MKLNVMRVLSVILIIACLAMAVACDSDGSKENENENSTTEVTATESESISSAETGTEETTAEEITTEETTSEETTSKETIYEETTSEETTSEETTTEETETETERFNYFEADMSEYISVDSSLYDGVTVGVSKEYLIGDEQIAKYIDSQRLKNSTIMNEGAQVKDAAIRFGDAAFIYYKGFLDGVEFSGGSNWTDAKPHELLIGSGSFIPGFEDGLIGVVPADTTREEPFKLNVTFPEDYGSAELAGKAVVFDVYIAYAVQYELPEYNETFVTEILKFEAEGEDVIAEYEQYVKKLLENEVSVQVENDALNDLWTGLFDNATVIKYPEGEVEYYYSMYLDEYNYYMQMYNYYGYSFKNLDEFVPLYLGLAEGADWRAETRLMAQKDTMQYLIFHSIAQNEGMEVTEEDYNSAIQYYIDYYKNSYNQTYTKAEIVEMMGEDLIKEFALYEKVNAFMLENCVIEYV